jgi:hypothetical protein
MLSGKDRGVCSRLSRLWAQRPEPDVRSASLHGVDRRYRKVSQRTCWWYSVYADVIYDIYIYRLLTFLLLKVSGGDDCAEDVAGGLEVALQQEWGGESGTRLILHIADAPAHGLHFHDELISDRFPKGDPRGYEPSELLRGIRRRKIDYYFGRISVILNFPCRQVNSIPNLYVFIKLSRIRLQRTKWYPCLIVLSLTVRTSLQF